MNGRLPLLNKLLYASDGVGSGAISGARGLWLLFFLVPPETAALPSAIPPLDLGPLHLDPRVFAAVLLTVGRVIEAFDDPVIGWWSDRTRSRWGRRIPFMLFSTPFFGAFFALLWVLPGGSGSMVNAVYVFVVLELFFLSSTLSGGPYESLLPEIARSHRDRMSVVTWQFYFALLGAVLGLVLTGFLKDAFGFKVMGTVMAVFGLTFRYVAVGGVWNVAPRTTPVAEIKLVAAFRATMANKQFLYFLPTYVLFQASFGMVIAWLPFMAVAVLDAGNGGSITSLLTGVALVGMVLSAFGLWKLSDAKGKAWVYSACLLGSAVYMPLLFFAGFIPGIPKLAQVVVFAFLAGVPMAGVNLLPRAITADITDYDELRTGMRREGMFYSTQNLFEKIASSLSPLLLALVLLLGETEEHPLGIRLVGPVAGVIAFFGFWLFRGYRLPNTVNRETVKAAGLEI
jgi:GPH family glycoside/pentoside/hexuronide:cation symporter